MKKTITVIALLAGAVAGYSQGSMSFYMDNAGNTKEAIYGPMAGTYSVTYGGQTVTETVGNSTYDTPTGSTSYTSALLGGTAATGTAYDAILLEGNGSGLSIGQLSPIGTVLNFFTTTANAGFLKNSVVENITGNGGQNVTVAVAAWQATGTAGAATSLAAAESDGYAWGISQTGNVTLSTGSETLATMPASVESFSLGAVPEPSTIALGVIGASALLFRRRK